MPHPRNDGVTSRIFVGERCDELDDTVAYFLDHCMTEPTARFLGTVWLTQMETLNVSVHGVDVSYLNATGQRCSTRVERSLQATPERLREYGDG